MPLAVHEPGPGENEKQCIMDAIDQIASPFLIIISGRKYGSKGKVCTG